MTGLFTLSIVNNLFRVSGTDSIPSFRLLLHEVCRFDLSKTATQATVCDNVKATVDLLSHSAVRNLCKRHLVESLLFSESLVSNRNINLVFGLKSLLLVRLSLVSFI